MCGWLLFWRPGYTFVHWLAVERSDHHTTNVCDCSPPLLPPSTTLPFSLSSPLPLSPPPFPPPPPLLPPSLPLAHCRNSLAAEEQVSYLALCPALRSLTLDGNPVCRHMAQDEVRGGVVGVACGVHVHVCGGCVRNKVCIHFTTYVQYLVYVGDSLYVCMYTYVGVHMLCV